MERPNHDLQAMGFSSKKSRAVSLAITIALQVGVVIALILGLAQAQLHKEILAINASVEKKQVQPKAPPPPPPDLVRPPPPTAIVPQFAIEAPPPPRTAPAPPAAPAKVAPTELHAIARTHSLPPYPALSQRLGEQGTTLLKVTIGLDGNVTDVSVAKSSGSDRLDQAAAEYVKDHWRWQPPTQDGKPIVATTLVSVVWDLKNAQ